VCFLLALLWLKRGRKDELILFHGVVGQVASVAPSVRVAVAEEFGLPPGSVKIEQLVAGLKKLGFDYVFDTNFTADLTILEEGTELLERLEKGGPFPMFTSCCPGWINLVEKAYPEYIPNLSTCKSPQGKRNLFPN